MRGNLSTVFLYVENAERCGTLKTGDYAAKDSQYTDYYSNDGQFLVSFSIIHIRKNVVFGVAIRLNECFEVGYVFIAFRISGFARFYF